MAGASSGIGTASANEVLGSVSDEEQDFLAETSVLRRLTGDLCDAVTGRPGGAETLIGLERCNAFVIPLDRHDHRRRDRSPADPR